MRHSTARGPDTRGQEKERRQCDNALGWTCGGCGTDMHEVGVVAGERKSALSLRAIPWVE